MPLPVFKVKERPEFLYKAQLYDYLYCDTDSEFDLANLFFIKEILPNGFKLKNMASYNDDELVEKSYEEIKSANWQIQLLPFQIRKYLGIPS